MPLKSQTYYLAQVEIINLQKYVGDRVKQCNVAVWLQQKTKITYLPVQYFYCDLPVNINQKERKDAYNVHQGDQGQ